MRTNWNLGRETPPQGQTYFCVSRHSNLGDLSDLQKELVSFAVELHNAGPGPEKLEEEIQQKEESVLQRGLRPTLRQKMGTG